MGFWSGIKLAASLPTDPTHPTTPDLLAAVATAPYHQVGILSPWQEGNLGQITALSDLFDLDVLPVTRAEAMTVPAVVKARNILCGAIAGMEWAPFDLDGNALPRAKAPTGLYATRGASSPYTRMLWTVDDLLFHPYSLWAVQRGTRTGGALYGPVLQAVRVPIDRWRITPQATIEVDGREVSDDAVVLIPGPTEGLLAYAARTIRAAVNVERSWAGRVRNPIPVMELHHNEPDADLQKAEVDAYLAAFAAARRDPDGALVYTPSKIDLKVHGSVETDTLVEARNAIRLDVANFTGLPGEALDGSLSTASLTYTTQEGTRTELQDALTMWTDPLHARMSQDDIVGPGMVMRLVRRHNLPTLPTATQDTPVPTTQELTTT